MDDLRDLQRGEPLLQGIAFAACAGRNFALLGRIAEKCLPRLWTAFLETGLEPFALVSPAERESWAAAVVPTGAIAGQLNGT